MFTVFVPTNDALAAAGLSGAAGADATAIVNNSLSTQGALTAQQLVDSGTTSFGGAVLTFGGTADALTVNGFAATLLDVPESASTIFSIDGVIQ